MGWKKTINKKEEMEWIHTNGSTIYIGHEPNVWIVDYNLYGYGGYSKFFREREKAIANAIKTMKEETFINKGIGDIF